MPTGDEVAQSGASDAKSVGSDELREPRRRNSPSDPTSREIEDHVLTGLCPRAWSSGETPRGRPRSGGGTAWRQFGSGDA